MVKVLFFIIMETDFKVNLRIQKPMDMVFIFIVME